MTERIEKPETHLLAEVNRFKKDEEDKSHKQTISPSKPDSFGGRVSQFIHSIFHSISPFAEKPSEKILPPGISPKQMLASKLEKLGFSKEEIKNILFNHRHNHSGLPTLEDYASSDRYEIHRGHKKKSMSIFNNSHQFIDQKFAEELRKTLQLKMEDDIESREIARVAIAMCFAAAYPVVAIRALGNLLSTLTTPAAESLAGNAISTISSFAAKWYLNDAANHPEKARALMQALLGISGHHSHEHSHHNGDLNSHVPGSIDLPHEHSETIATEEIVVKDKETGKIVDVFYVNTMSEEESYNHESEHLSSHNSAMANINEATRLAQSIDKEAERIFGDAELERFQTSETDTELLNIDRLLANTTDPQKIAELKTQKSSLNSKKNFLTYG